MEDLELEEKEIKEDEMPKKVSKTHEVGRLYFGDTFEKWMKIADIKDLIPAFKDFYYQTKIKDPDSRLSDILQTFNKDVCVPVGRKFHPYTNQIRCWRKKWDLDLLQQLQIQKVLDRQGKDIQTIERKNVNQLIKTRNAERELVLGQAGDNELEAGVRTLGGELLNDAMQMLRDDQELEEIYTSDELMKRRSYVVNVFAHATRLVHGKAALMLKASEEKRNTAGFLMSLLARATAGQMTEEEMGVLKSSYSQPVKQESAQNG